MAASPSRFLKILWLSDWWLIWANNENHQKRLAVAGFISRGQKALQIFSSAPIRKRYDVFTLETTDDICVMINGFMNKARTVENGFPYEASDHFLFGFPPHWEACAEKYLGQGFASNDVSRVDASLKDSSAGNEGIYEKSFTREHVSPDSAYQKLNEDHTVCMIHEGSKKSDKAIRCITSHGSATNTDCNKAAYDEKETGENVSPAGADPKLNEDHTGCMIQEGSKKSDNAVGYITCDGGATNTDRKKTASDVKETAENVSPASADPKLDQDHTTYITQKSLKKSDKAGKCVTSAGGAKNTDHKETAAVVEETGENASPASADAKLNHYHTVRVCMIQEDPKNTSTATRYLTGAVGTKNTNCKETAAVEKESVENVRPTSADPELNEDGTVTVCMIQECSKKSSTVLRYLTSSGGAKNMDCKKAASFEKETAEYVSPANADPILDHYRTVCMTKKRSKKSNKAVRFITTVGGSKDRKKTAVVVEETGENVDPSGADPKMEQDHTVCMTQGGSKKSNKAARYITRASGGRNIDCKKTEVTTVCGSKNCKEIAAVVGKTVENVGPSNADPKLDQDHTVCMIQEGSKKSKKTARYITRASGGRNRDGKKTDVTTVCGSKDCKETAAAVEGTGEIVGPSSADPKLDQDHTVCMTQEGSKKSNKAARYIARASGGRNTDCKKTAAVGKESSIKEKITVEEESTPGKTTKRKLRYGSPITPKVDELASVVSPESLSTKKSRSGRLLLPTLEYWRNQMAVYDADHQVVGIKQGISTSSKLR